MVDIVQWEDKYSVGINEIDEQHKKLFKVANTFIENFDARNFEDMKTALRDLIDYACYHFGTEEHSYLLNHPDVEKHQREHVFFVEKITDLYENCLDETDVSEELLDFLLSWITNHILTIDKHHLTGITR